MAGLAAGELGRFRTEVDAQRIRQLKESIVLLEPERQK
jgi:hypothetical protein